MKDILILVVLIGALIWVISSTKPRENTPSVSAPTASSGSVPSKLPSERLKALPPSHPGTLLSNARGKLNERTNRKFSKAKNRPEDSGSSVDAAEIKKLTSIYATEDATSSAASVAAAKSGVTHSAEHSSPARTPVIRGVPAKAYVMWKQSNIPYAEITPPTPNGVNVYVGCLDVQKNWQYTGEKVCEHLHTVKPQVVMDPLISRVGGGTGNNTY